MSNTTQKLGIEITTDLKQSVESFKRLQQDLSATQTELTQAQAKAAQLKAGFEAAGSTVDHLGIQLALAKKALADLAANGVAKTHVEYQALTGEIANLQAELKRQSAPLKALERDYQAAERAAGRFQQQSDRQTADLARQGQALRRAGLDIANLDQAYRRLSTSMPMDKLGSTTTRAQAALERMGQQGSEPWVFIGELKRDFDVRQVAMDVESIDPAIKVLLVIQ